MKELALHILDVARNSIEAGATLVQIEVIENTTKNLLHITITDNGRGMGEETLQQVGDAFFTTRTTRKVGLGLPLIKMNAEQAGGGFKIASEPGKGTCVKAWFELNHIDRQPLGDIASVIVMLSSEDEKVNVEYCHVFNENEYLFSSSEIKKELDGVPINDPGILKFLKEMINENIAEISRIK
jgi:anti-sigma regulatory factor (Ser/Thr protein kinase)